MSTILLVLGCGLLDFSEIGPPSGQPFVSEAWRSADPSSGDRLAMVDDLVQNHLRVGMPRAEIVALLGEPGAGDDHTCHGAPAEGADETLCYTLGVDLDPYTLLISLEDGVVREPRDLDVAMVFGTGFPPFRGGLLRYADAIGPAVLVDRLARLADAHGERFRPAPLLRDMVRAESRFYAS